MGKRGGCALFGWFFRDWQMVHPFAYLVTSLLRAGHQKSHMIAQAVFEIPGCPAVTGSWYSKITPLLNEASSTTTSLLPYQKSLPSFFRGYVVAQHCKVSCCFSWWARTLSSMEDRVAARVNKQARVVVRVNKCGGSTVTLELLSVPFG